MRIVANLNESGDITFNKEVRVFSTLFLKKVGLSFARAFIGTVVLGLVIPSNLSDAKAVYLALAAAGLTAGIRAVQALFTQLETPPQ